MLCSLRGRRLHSAHFSLYLMPSGMKSSIEIQWEIRCETEDNKFTEYRAAACSFPHVFSKRKSLIINAIHREVHKSFVNAVENKSSCAMGCIIVLWEPPDWTKSHLATRGFLPSSWAMGCRPLALTCRRKGSSCQPQARRWQAFQYTEITDQL